MDKLVLKRKSQMVLYALETALGKLIVETNSIENISPQLLKSVEDREIIYGKSFDATNVADLVRASYFNEIFDIVVQSLSSTTSEGIALELRKLVDIFKLVDVRNNLSHPNRDFSINDWYKVACISTDPIIERLKLTEVTNSFLSAESGQLIDPPQEWLEQISIEITNNLPTSLEHDVTGLVGRNSEVKKLAKKLYNKRISSIAIVAPGGIGKTALALELLNNLAYSNEFAGNFKGIVFASLKKEQLTADGIKQLDAIESIDELKYYLLEQFQILFAVEAETFEELCSETEDFPVVVFIDNLETLLRDSQDVFNEFNTSLPISWKILITSRLNVANSDTLPLDSLNTSSSIHLARQYQKSKGGESLPEHKLELIAMECQCNPLAIKITLDYFNLGHELPKSYKHASQSIAEFSFKNLLEVLGKNSTSILELLFTTETCTRKDINYYLDVSLDEVARAISELTNTSLIKRLNDTEIETFRLIESAREYLLLNPRDLNIRRRIQEKVRRIKDQNTEITKIQKQSNISPFEENYVPEDISSELRVLLSKVNKALKSREQNHLVKVYQELSELKTIYKSDYIFHKTLARVYQAMHDYVNAMSSAVQATSLKPSDVSTKIVLAKLKHNDGDYPGAENIYSTIMSSDNAEDVMKVRVVWLNILNGYFLSLLFQDKLEDVLEQTKTWNKDGEYGSTLGTYRASAHKRKFDNYPHVSLVETFSSINSCLKIINNVLKEHGYFSVACREAFKIIDTVIKILAKIQMSGQSNVDFNKQREHFLEFCSNHIVEIFENQRKTNELAEYISGFKEVDVNTNPFHKYKWKNYIGSPSYEIGVEYSTLIDKGFQRVKIINIPKDGQYRRAFIFAIDPYEQRYFIDKRTLKNGTVEHFNRLQIGDELAIKHNEEKGKELPVANQTFILRVS